MNQQEETEQTLNDMIVGKWAPEDLEGALRIAVAYIRDGKRIPKDYYVQPLIKLFKREQSKDIAKLSFHTGIDIKTLNGYLASKGKDASQYRQNYAKSVLEPVKEQSNV